MYRLKCIIVDDEPLAVEILETYIEKISWLEHSGSFENGLDALDFLTENRIDVVFLDIQMPDITGLEFARITRDKISIVFTTAYHQYAVEGFELEARDYLLKPISFDRFLKSVQKMKPLREVVEERADYIFLKAEYKIIKVAFCDIHYIEGMKDYLRVVTKTDKIMTLQSFSKLIPKLPADRFIRVHKSYVIAMDAIDSLERGKVRLGDKYIPVGDAYKSNFDEYIKRRMA